MLADHIGNAFGLHLTGRAILARLADNLSVFHRQGVEFGVGCLMDQRFQRLRLAHALVDVDFLLQQVIAAFGRLRLSELNGHRGQLFYRRHELCVLRHFAGQLVHAVGGEFLPLRLAYVEHVDDPKIRPPHERPFLFGLAVRAEDRRHGLRVDLLLEDKFFAGHGGKDLDAFLAGLYRPAKFLFPFPKARDNACLWALPEDQENVSKAVPMELGYGGEVALVSVALENVLDAAFQLVRQRFDASGELIAPGCCGFFHEAVN